MNGRQFPIIPVLLLCTMALCAYWLYKNVEMEEVEYEAEQSEEARNNQFLAATRLLELEEFNFDVAEDRRVFYSLNIEDTGVLWLADTKELNDQQEADDIHAWIESGGILLTSPQSGAAFEESTVSGTFLEKLGIHGLDDEEAELAEIEHDNTMYQGDDYYNVDLQDAELASTKIALYSDVVPYFKNIRTNDSAIREIIDTPYLVHKQIGQGYALVYSDRSMFNNDLIQYDEHAYLLLWFTQPAKLKKLAIVFRPDEKPGLFKVLWYKFTLAILLLGLVLAGFLRLASTRLGPIEHELPPIQNNLMAHLAARGEYWYRHNHTDKIVANVQSAAIETLRKQQGKTGAEQATDSVDRAATVKQASEVLDCSPVTAEHALFGTVKKDAAILSASRSLQNINHQKPFKPK